ncbi:MAG: hypothetical protein V7K89_26105, partial [Nostoc sp.]|uniref:hypothetical protein n=1 Tax=Nostoc sp. TaxID=1180 RepID=UPI002FFAE5CF
PQATGVLPYLASGNGVCSEFSVLTNLAVAINIECWEYNEVIGEPNSFFKGTFWILPGKSHIFLDSLHPVYADFLKGKYKGIFSESSLLTSS